MSKARRSGLLLLIAACVTACATRPPAHVPVALHEPAIPYAVPLCDDEFRSVLQGYNSSYSHHGREAYAIDIALPLGTPVCAARSGLVIEAKGDSDRGGPSSRFAEAANLLRIRHRDGTIASYLHFEKDGVLPVEGDCVRRGQLIGRAGNTGWSTEPHLHFMVQARVENAGLWSVPVTMMTSAGLRNEYPPGLFLKR
ncbi:MAG: M23 family metallopeptidase, partial [Gammaproteobacteria bacterium]|nr:M23 family metallopeptidase [Gammaproteobacteria bacterium]